MNPARGRKHYSSCDFGLRSHDISEYKPRKGTEIGGLRKQSLCFYAPEHFALRRFYFCKKTV